MFSSHEKEVVDDIFSPILMEKLRKEQWHIFMKATNNITLINFSNVLGVRDKFRARGVKLICGPMIVQEPCNPRDQVPSKCTVFPLDLFFSGTLAGMGIAVWLRYR